MKEDDIDFILVWDSCKEQTMSQESTSKRQIFQRNLIEEGLKLEEESMEGTEIQMIKIHAPIEVLRRYTEILNLRMPMKEISELQQSSSPNGSNNILFESSTIPKKSWTNYFTKYMELDPILFPPIQNVFSATYSRDKEYLFDIKSTQNGGFFNSNIRSLIIDFILRRSHYIEKNELDDHGRSNNEFGIGIESLISDKVYFGAYPLHDGDVKTPGSIRSLLYKEWGSLSKICKYQPLDTINTYFGLKVAVYFAWLGFYTEMLIPISILGIIAFLYGVFTLSENPITNDTCNGTIIEPMCPHCDQYCGYWNISDICAYSKLTHLFDNDATVIFSIFSSFWTIIFLERWKRYSAEIKYRWDLNSDGENDQNPRPNYLARLRKANEKKINGTVQINSNTEPSIDFWRTKLPNMLLSLSTILFLTFMALAAVVSVILYRLSVKFALLSRWAPTDPSVHSWGLMITNMTAVCLNLIFIVFFNWIYSFLAEYLTELELHRTQAEFDDSLTLKMYILQFINYYASIFYIAFFKGRFAGTPYEYKHFFSYRHEECGSGGCMAELCIQLSIVMIGKQAMNAVFEMGKPLVTRWIKTHFKTHTENKKGHTILHAPHTQVARDMSLTPWTTLSLFPEYLEMVLQFGFSTIFVSAFPLAPFFALLNNIFEIRLDGSKLLKYYQRPVGAQVASIGIWYDILESITKLAVMSNALIIAFTSNFIPKLIYRMEYGNLNGFLEHSLASFNTSLFPDGSKPKIEEHHIRNAEVCRYHSFNIGHSSQGTLFFWEIWVARLIFIVLYQNGIFFGVMIIQWMIPDVPPHVQEKIRQENYLINKIVIKKERNKSRIAAGGDPGGGGGGGIEEQNGSENYSSRGNIKISDQLNDFDLEESTQNLSNLNSKKKKLSGSGRELSFTDSLENIP